MTAEEIQELKALTMNSPRLLTRNELAIALGVNYRFIANMTKWGFKMPGGKSSIRAVHDWLKANPDYQTYKAPKELPRDAAHPVL